MPNVEVIIHKNAPGEVTQTTSVSSTTEEPGKESRLQGQVNALLVNYGKQLLKQGVDTYIYYSGDYILENKIDAALNVAADIGVMVSMGLPGIAAVTFKRITQEARESLEYRRTVETIRNNNDRLGVIAMMGGRYTDD